MIHPESQEKLPLSNPTLEKIRSRVQSLSSCLCVGVDLHEQHFQLSSNDLETWLSEYLQATHQSASAFKFQLSGFLSLGGDGIYLLNRLIKRTSQNHPDIPIILDGKFTDIDISLQHYAQFAFDYLGVDALTTTPYFGHDTLSPLLDYHHKLIYFTCSSSNPDSDQFQNYPLASPLYQRLAATISSWNQHGNCGLVVAATHPERIQAIRQAAWQLPFLMPGLGNQAAQVEDFLTIASNGQPESVLVNVSRALATSLHPEDQALSLAKQLSYIAKVNHQSTASLAEQLTVLGCLQYGEFVLASGEKSSIYLDLRRLISSPETLAKVAYLLTELTADLDYEVIATIATAGLPLATAFSLEVNKPLVYVRSDKKEHGLGKQIEGGLDLAGKKVLLLDDVLSTGASKLAAIAILTSAGAQIEHLLVVVDRRLRSDVLSGIKVHSLLTLKDLHFPK